MPRNKCCFPRDTLHTQPTRSAWTRVNFGDVTLWLYGHLTLPTNGNSGHTETSGSYYLVPLRVIRALKVLLEPSIVSELRLSVRTENLTHHSKIYELASHDYLCLTRTRLYSK